MQETRIIRDKDGCVHVERFSRVRRWEHSFAIAIFVTLVLTGFPQLLWGDWSVRFMGLFGGLDNMRVVHRIAGVVFTAHAAVHLSAIVVGVMTKRMRLALLPGPQDLRDAWHNLAYYLGLKSSPPPLPKFDYRQKFEYMGIVLGGLVMVFSGLILMYPILTASWLPGQVIPAARVAHSNEATLALLVLVVWHIYGSHLSPEVFPMDRSIFSGYISRDELRERHQLEYQRIFGSDSGSDEASEAAVAEQAAVPSASAEPS